jgi:hypothetical protein
LQTISNAVESNPFALDRPYVYSEAEVSALIEAARRLERHRSNSIRTRNARLAALRSFMKHVGACDPAALPIVQRVLAIPLKRLLRFRSC